MNMHIDFFSIPRDYYVVDRDTGECLPMKKFGIWYDLEYYEYTKSIHPAGKGSKRIRELAGS